MDTANGEIPSVLVVDDEEGIREGSERILKRMGCRVLTASNGELGTDMISREPVGLVLLDLKMPGMDGMEVLQWIRDHHPQILVIVITGFATVETAIEAMKQGAYDFISKPFEPDQLRIVVARALEKLRLTREAEKLAWERAMTLADLGREKSRTRTIIESLPNGVVVTNAEGQVVLTNPAFLAELNHPPERPAGGMIHEYVTDEGFCKLVMDISQGCHIDFEDIQPYEFSISENRYLMAHAKPVLGERNECLGAVVNLTNVTTWKVLERLKSEFVAQVTHELRSPLATIHEQLALVLKDVMEQAPQKDRHLISRAQEKTRGLISTIGDLLDLSRIESGNVGKEMKPVRIETLLNAIVDFLGTRAQTKGQTLTLETPPDRLPELTADPKALESIFGNLIANAINYTPEGGRIEVRVEATGSGIRVSVKDSGFGIEAKYLDKIFESFYRVKTEKTRFITGTGLGLPIVKGLLDSLGGKIFVESEPNQGSTFTVLLPLKQTACEPVTV
ncbi:MAG: response regulator [Desulfobacterales bacterium]|nr:response regulator [Desulfobacterales bacterium]